MKKLWSLLILMLAISISSCDPEPVVQEPDPAATAVKVVFEVTYKDDPFVIGNIVWDDFGNRLRFDNFMSYISMLTLVKEDGTELLLKDFYLANFGEENQFTIEVPAATYTGLQLGIGIPHEYNKDQDPSQYPNDHPLSIQGSEGMFWAWNTGYIFTKFEGKADTLGIEGEPLLHPFSFHIGDDPFFRQHEEEGLNIVVKEGQTKTVKIKIAADKILFGEDDQIDLATDFITHTSDNTELAIKFVDNFNDAISVE